MPSEIMVFNLVRVVRIEPGAELDGTVYDQWIHIEFGGKTISVFDHEMIAPDYAPGELHEVKLRLMATSIEPTNSRASGIAGNRYYGRVIYVSSFEGLFDHIVDVNGLKIHLFDQVKHPIGEYLSIKGRLDLDDIKHPRTDKWRTI